MFFINIRLEQDISMFIENFKSKADLRCCRRIQKAGNNFFLQMS